ncbi:MAG: ABC transporter permease [Ignisphaera sp.]
MSERKIILRLLKKNTRFWICLSLVLTVVMLALIGPLITPYKPNQPVVRDGRYIRSLPPTIEHLHLFGVDNLGYDVFAATVYGLRVSLSVGAIAAIVATVVGVILGLIAGYVGGWADLVIDGATNVLLAMPPVFIMIMVGTFYIAGLGMPGKELQNIAFLGCLIGLLSWHWTARAVRSQVAALKVSDFIAISRLSGNHPIKIIMKDVLPNIASYILLVFVIQLANALSTVVTLEFLGIKAAEWSLFARVQQWLQMGALITGVWWALFLPGVVIVMLIASLYIIVLALEEVFNPRLRKV